MNLVICFVIPVVHCAGVYKVKTGTAEALCYKVFKSLAKQITCECFVVAARIGFLIPMKYLIKYACDRIFAIKTNKSRHNKIHSLRFKVKQNNIVKTLISFDQKGNLVFRTTLL